MTQSIPQLLTDVEKKSLQELAEAVWADLQKNELGGYSGINRPFYLVWMFKIVIERYGYRDVGLKHSKDALDEAYERGRKAGASPPPAPQREPLTIEQIEQAYPPGITKHSFAAGVRFAEQAHGIKEGS
jgi:hypothetical protein